MRKAPDLILASASPRRTDILGRLQIPFSVMPASVDETPRPDESPRKSAERVALAKAEEMASQVSNGIVLGADTVVALRGQILGKPKDSEEALSTLRSLRGRLHRVITAIALLNLDTKRRYLASVTTKVWMRSYGEEEMAAYIASGDPFDKAGSYAIQNPILRPVERIEGCYFNVVGLPLCEVVEGLQKLGYPSEALPIDRLDTVCPHERSN